MYHANTSGSEASNISFSIPSSRRHIHPPRIDIFRNAFALDHDDLGAGVEKSLCLRNRAARVARPFGLEFRGRGCAARAKLNSHLGFAFIPDLRTNSIRRSQSSVGMETKPAEISMISKVELLTF